MRIHPLFFSGEIAENFQEIVTNKYGVRVIKFLMAARQAFSPQSLVITCCTFTLMHYFQSAFDKFL
jgi:hypothetical protein